MKPPSRKLYLYVDESGQDTFGRVFIVAVLVTSAARAELERKLLNLEVRSGKGKTKWTKSRPAARTRYVQGLLEISELARAIFLFRYFDTKNYFAITAMSASKALALVSQTSTYSAVVYVDGLQGSEPVMFRKYMRRFGATVSVVRGIRREENSAFIRLADAICGLMRDAESNIKAREAMLRCHERQIIRIIDHK